MDSRVKGLVSYILSGLEEIAVVTVETLSFEQRMVYILICGPADLVLYKQRGHHPPLRNGRVMNPVMVCHQDCTGAGCSLICVFSSKCRRIRSSTSISLSSPTASCSTSAAVSTTASSSAGIAAIDAPGNTLRSAMRPLAMDPTAPRSLVSSFNLFFIAGDCNIAHRNLHPSSPSSFNRAEVPPSRYSSKPPTLSIVRKTLVRTFSRSVLPSARLNSCLCTMFGCHRLRDLCLLFGATLLPNCIIAPP